MKEFLLVVYDEVEKKYYVHRPDDPSEPYHEISFGAILDLDKNLIRYQHDAWNEAHKQ